MTLCVVLAGAVTAHGSVVVTLCVVLAGAVAVRGGVVVTLCLVLAGAVAARDPHVSHRLGVVQSWQQATVVHASCRCRSSAAVDVVADMETCTSRLNQLSVM